MLATDTLIPYARNARTHSPEQVAQIAASIREFGFTNPVLIDGDHGIIAGHGRVMAAQKLGLEQVPCIRLDYLSDTQRRAYILADNKLAMNAGWDNEMLKLEIKELVASDFDIDLIGFAEDEVIELFNPPPVDIEDVEVSDGTMLGLLDVVIQEPRHQVNKGDVWCLGAHVLLCVEVMTDWPSWVPELEAGSVFAPYPGPYAAISEKAYRDRLVMVQPDKYVAGHILDRYAEVNGEDSIKQRLPA